MPTARATGLLRYCSQGELHPWGIRPQPGQVVVLPGLLVEEVDHEVAVVEKDPASLLHAFATEGAAIDRSKFLFHALGKRLDVRARSPADDDEGIRDDDER